MSTQRPPVLDRPDGPDRPDGSHRSRSRLTDPDLPAVAAAAVLVAVAAVVGQVLMDRGVLIHAGAAPLFGRIRPYLGPGTLLVLVGFGLAWTGPAVAARLSWSRLLAVAGAATVAWTAALALVRGAGGLLHPLATPSEYLTELPRIQAIGSLHSFLTGFSASIPATADLPWRTHVAGHPPGMTLVFVLLDRFHLGPLDLSGPGPAATACLLAWAVGVVAVAATVRRLAGEPTARAALPFLVVTPAVVWAGVSADALLAGAGAVGLYLLTRALPAGGPPGHAPDAEPGGRARWATSRVLWAAGAGLVLGLCCFLSYGAPLLGVPALAIVLHQVRSHGLPTRAATTVVGAAVIAALVVVGAFWAGGFAWWEGFQALHGRYLAGYGGDRPYAYWVWADVAALAVAVGPAVVAGLRRVGLSGAAPAVRVLAGAALAAVLIAALTGMSKAEVERIWLPWTIWLPVACALLPAQRARPWLLAQVATAVLIEHLLLSPW